jgi:hypothetical protein
MVTHFTHFEKVAVFSGSVRPKIRTEENIETVQGQMEDEPQLFLKLRFPREARRAQPTVNRAPCTTA